MMQMDKKAEQLPSDIMIKILSGILESVDGLVAVIDKDCRVLMSNWKGHEHISPKDKQSKSRCYDIFKHRTIPCEYCPPMDTFKDGQPRVYEDRNPVDGSFKRIQVTPIFDDNGQVSQVIEHVVDITEQKQAAEVLKQAKGHFTGVYDYADDAIIVHDAQGTILEVNQKARNQFAYTRNDFLNLTMQDLHPPHSLTKARWAIEQVVENGFVICEIEFKTKKGNCFPAKFTANRFKIGDGVVIQCLIRDISERKKAQEELTKSRQQLKAMLAANPDPMVMYDTQGLPLFLNPAFTQIFGWTLDELQGRRIPFVPLDQQKATRAIIEEVYQTRETVRFQTKRLTKQGDTIDVIISAAVIKGKDDEAAGMIVNLTDISDQKKLEDQLKQAQKMEAIGRLAGGVAHDFNNMLTIISGNTEIAMEEISVKSPAISNLKEIQTATQRSIDLTRQLLAFARKQTIAPKVIDLNDTIQGLLKMLGRLIGEAIDLSWLPKSGLWPVKVDPSQVDQILVNLCINARDAIQGIGKITIETVNVRLDDEYCRKHMGFKPGNYAMIVVSDTGCGMDKKTLDNLFDPFFTTKDIGQGTGLGLSTVYGITKQNKGFINVYSEPNQGTTFKIYLPKHHVEQIQTYKEQPDVQGANGEETILLVEDESSILKLTSAMLERLGYNVMSAFNPADALHMGQSYQGSIDLLLTDVVMPEMSGRDLAEKLIISYPNLKCLYMSGYTANVIAHHGILDEGIQFINKPFMKSDLAIKVREVLDMK